MSAAGSHHRWFGLVMWGAIGLTFMLLTVVAIYQLDPQIARYATGGLIFVCLTVCGVALWLDTRTTPTTTRLSRLGRWSSRWRSKS